MQNTKCVRGRAMARGRHHHKNNPVSVFQGKENIHKEAALRKKKSSLLTNTLCGKQSVSSYDNSLPFDVGLNFSHATSPHH